MKNPLYLPIWFLKARFFGYKKPLQTVLFITDQCNLQCKHCAVYAKEKPLIKNTEQIKEELLYSYRLGSRFVDFEGGEPFLWKDGDNNINDLCDLAKKIGFYSTTITTNAQKDFSSSRADSIWVSMDGIGDFHNDIRGKNTFERLEKNIANCGHKALSVNMVINKRNYTCLGETLEYVKKNPSIKSISLNFYTPHEKAESEEKTALHIDDWKLRSRIIDEIIEYKKIGYPIMNSISGLQLMKHNRFDKKCWVSNFILPDGSRLSECPGKTEGICDDCGFCMAGEMQSVFRLKPDTIWHALKLRMFS